MQGNVANNMIPESYLDNLNPEQLEAVETTEGPVLVLAGAGTGKTRVLTTRIAHILLTNKAFPNQILAVTFTNKASREMKDRVASLLARDVGGMWIGTFHSICAKMLRRHAEVIGFKTNFTILDSDDQIRLLKAILKELNIDDKRWSAKTISAIIQGFKDKNLTPDKIENTAQNTFADGRIGEIYTRYQNQLKQLNAMDFGDLLLHTLTIFLNHSDILAQYQRFFRYILVDEYQDTNVAQYLWLRLLAQGSNNICCVGDDDQSIYSWRGAEVGNILRFEKDFANPTIIKLERNYRSTAHILAAASKLISNNRGRFGKTLRTEDENGELIRTKHLWDGDEEAKFVAGEIESAIAVLNKQKAKYSDFAVLVRAGFQTRSFEERFITLAIPYRVIGGLRFYERQEIRDAIAYIRVLMDDSNDLAFERIINLPKRGLGKSSLELLYRFSRTQGISLYQATKAMVQTKELITKPRQELEKLLASFDKWRAMLNEPDIDHEEVVEIMLDESGYVNMWKEEAKKEKGPEAEGRLENLGELIRAIAEFENLTDFLDHISLVMDNDEAKDGEMVSIMTLHAAKGLEFNTVFLPGWEEGLFPHQRALDESGDGGLEEERRLAYVGITRARRLLYITHAANRRIYNQWQTSVPSRFLKELPPENITELPTNLSYSRPQQLNVPEAALDFEPKLVVAKREDGMQLGTKVRHAKFGDGVVLKAVGDNLDIHFTSAGRKTLKSQFVEKV
jgi:DNA helicase-2/ATP-dependent DNA helicase PcrA